MNADAQPTDWEPLDPEQLPLAVEVFRMLADSTRLQILWQLARAESSVNEIAAALGRPGPSVSQHLAKLRMARLVRSRREGQQIFYELENDHVLRLVTDGLHNAEHVLSGVPRHHRQDPAVTPIPAGYGRELAR